MCGQAEGGMREGSSGRWCGVCWCGVKVHCSWTGGLSEWEDEGGWTVGS